MSNLFDQHKACLEMVKEQGERIAVLTYHAALASERSERDRQRALDAEARCNDMTQRYEQAMAIAEENGTRLEAEIARFAALEAQLKATKGTP